MMVARKIRDKNSRQNCGEQGRKSGELALFRSVSHYSGVQHEGGSDRERYEADA